MTAKHTPPTIEEVEIVAAAIYDADQDMLDEHTADRVAAGDRSTVSERQSRLAWPHVADRSKAIYVRRARAVLAALADDATALLEKID